MKIFSFTLRTKTMLFTSAILFCLIAFLYFVSATFLMNGFIQVEQDNTQKNVQRAHDAFSDDINQISTMTRDWAWWDDTYQFIEDANPEYIESNPTDVGFEGLRLNLILYLNSTGGIVFSKGYDLDNSSEVPVSNSLLTLLNTNNSILFQNNTEQNVNGIVILPEKPMLVASYPILTSDRGGPVRGTLIFGRYLDEKEISRLSEITHLSFKLHLLDEPDIPADLNAQDLISESIIVRAVNEDSISGYTMLNDIYGDPALLMEVSMPRPIYNQGKAGVYYLFVSLLAVGVVFGWMFLWFLEKRVLSRIADLNTDVNHIEENAEFSGRVRTDKESDELSNLRHSVNRMIVTLERSQKEQLRTEEELRNNRDLLEEMVEERTIELQKSEEKYRSLVESTDDSIYMVDRDCNYLFINENHRKRLGVTDLSCKNYGDFHLKNHTESFRNSVDRVYETGKREQQEYEFRGRWFLRTLSPVKSHDSKEVMAVTVISTDITDRKKAEEMRTNNLRLEFASKAKSEFLANMSHELRTPLNAIIGFSELMIGGMAGELNEKQRHYVDNVLKSGKFLLDIISDILDISKIEAGKIELMRERISVTVTINEVLTLVKDISSKRNVLIKREFDPLLDFIETDKLRFKQILFNLISNAIKFSKTEGGTVTITANKVGDMAKFSVSDTGIGIKEEDIDKLFKEFGQVSYGITRKYGGTGLGLAISKKLIELHGGEITVESKYGEGSTFTFTLPVTAKKEGSI